MGPYEVSLEKVTPSPGVVEQMRTLGEQERHSRDGTMSGRSWRCGPGKPVVGRLPGVSTSGRKFEDQTLPSGGGCGPESSLQPGQADATVGCRAWSVGESTARVQLGGCRLRGAGSEDRG